MSANPNFNRKPTGRKCPIISEELYNFKAGRLDSLELPTQNLVLKSVFTGRTKRVKRQALVQLQIYNVSLHQIILISPQLVTPLLLGMDFCMDNNVAIYFPTKPIVIDADDEESATEIDLVNERRNIDSNTDSPLSRAINLDTADLPPTPQLDRMVNRSIPDPPIILCNGRLPEEDLCHNQMTVEGTTLCNEVYSLFSGKAKDTYNEDEASSANNPNYSME